MSTKNNKAATETTSGKSVQTNSAESSQEQPTTTAPDGTTSETASDLAGTTTALAINGTNVPCISVPDLTILPPDDLMTASMNAWMLGRSAHDAIVACFKEIMYRYDGRKSNCPTYANVEKAFASIGVNYEAARKLVYRDTRKRELEAIAASLHLPSASTTTTSIFNVGDGVTIADGDGVIEHIHQTTGKIDVVLDESEETVTNVKPKSVTKLNGVAVIDGEVVKQKEHVLVAGELLIDPATGKKWAYADGKFSISKVLTRKEIKDEAISKLKAEREGACKRKEEEKKERKEEAARKDLDKVNAVKAKREAAQAKREAEHAKREAARLHKEEQMNRREAEAARKKAAKIEAAKARKDAAIQKKEAAARRAREKKEAKAAAKASKKPGEGTQLSSQPPANGIDYRPVIVGTNQNPHLTDIFGSFARMKNTRMWCAT